MPKRGRSPGVKVTHSITSSRDQENRRLQRASVMKMLPRFHEANPGLLTASARLRPARGRGAPVPGNGAWFGPGLPDRGHPALARRAGAFPLREPRAAPGRARILHAALALALTAFAGAALARSIQLDNGDVYEGDLVDGLRTGHGVYVWASGNRYEGEFVANRMQGQGTYNWVDGRSYTGAFVADRRHGQGVLTWRNGTRYEGQFEDDRIHGQGVFTWSNGDRYEGALAHGRRSGSGRFDWASGDSYVGEFLNDELHGQGLFTWLNGNRYSGGFANDQRHGLGVFHWRDGTVFRGRFRANKMHGYGVKEQPDGAMELQQWTDGGLRMRLPLTEDERCGLRLQDRYWMFSSEDCVNGLAHGRGLAASLDGELIIADGRFVLGHLVEGEAQPIWLRSRAR